MFNNCTALTDYVWAVARLGALATIVLIGPAAWLLGHGLPFLIYSILSVNIVFSLLMVGAIILDEK